MTVYSINKSVLEQAVAQAPSSKSAVSPEAAFAAALQKASMRFGGNDEVSANTVFKERFDRPVENKRETRDTDRGERQQPKAAERGGEGRRSERAAERRTEDKPVEKKVERPSESRSNEPAEAEAAPTAETPRTEDKADTGSNPSEGKAANEAQPGDGAAEPAADAAASGVADPAQQAAQIVVQPNAAALTQSSEANPDQDPFAWLEKDHGAAIEGLESQLTAGDATDDGMKAADDALLTAALAGESGDGEETQATGQATQAQAKQGQAKQATGNTELAQQQADDMADMLAGTGAAIKVKVTTDKPATEANTAAVLDDAATAADPLAAQDFTADALNDGQPQTGQGQNNQQNGQGVANAAQQVVRNGAMDNAGAAQGRAMDAKPFAAVLAAQAEGSVTQAGQSTTGAQPQAVAGVTGANAAQAAQKPAAAQAAQAPHQPRHVESKQVIDQISVQIGKQAKDGGNTIKVQLKPADLGSIEVKLEVQDGRVTTHVTADNKDTLAALQRDARGLEKALQEAGLKTDQGSMTFSLSNEGKQAQQETAQQGKPGRRSRLARAHEASGIDAQAAAQPMRSGGRAGVDIRV